MSRFAAAALVATAILGTTTACTGSSTGASTPTGASAATPSGSSPTKTSGAGDGTETRAAACTGPAIRVTVKNAGIATNHFGNVLIFTNIGGSACTLQGYPGVAVVKGSTTLLNATRSLSGFLADDPGISSAPLVTLPPGKSASTMVEWSGNAGEPCYATGTGTLEVTPPDTRNTASFGALTLGDNGICAAFEVHPVASGILRYLNN